MKALLSKVKKTLILTCLENLDNVMNCLDELLFLLDEEINHIEKLLPKNTLNPPSLVQCSRGPKLQHHGQRFYQSRQHLTNGWALCFLYLLRNYLLPCYRQTSFDLLPTRCIRKTMTDTKQVAKQQQQQKKIKLERVLTIHFKLDIGLHAHR